MVNARVLFLTLGLAALAPSTAAAAEPRTAPAEVLALREAAWRAWFAGDEAALRGMLPSEFIGIGWGDAPFSNLEASLGQSRAFHATGGRLVGLEFPETRAQRYGDVVVLYGRFVAVVREGEREQRVSGRLTEIFVKRDGRWLHPGWHLDEVK